MKLIAFDFDGVIINSLAAMEAAWSEISIIFPEASNVDFTSYLQFVGMPFPAIMQSLSLEGCMPSIQHQYFALTKKYQSLVHIYDGMKLVIDYCNSSQAFSTALVTSKSQSRTYDLCDSLKLKFDLIVCPEDTLRGKPYPDPLLFANKKLLCAPSASLYIGDMITDYSAAASAGWDFVYASWGYGNIPTNSPALITNSPSDLYSYLTIFK